MALSYLSSAGITHVGSKRKNNEDSIVLLPEYDVFCVADGMGGAQGGEVASAEVVEHLDEIFKALPNPEAVSSIGGRSKLVDKALNLASRAVKKYSSDRGISGTGSTAVVMAFDRKDPTRGMILHAGDSRAYRLRNRELVQISQDHTVAAAAGIKDDNDLPPMFRGVVTRAVGVKASVEIEQTPVIVAPGDLYLLASDGLDKMVSDARIQEILLSHPVDQLEAMAQALIDEANKNGGVDNVSVILVHVALDAPTDAYRYSREEEEAEAVFIGEDLPPEPDLSESESTETGAGPSDDHTPDSDEVTPVRSGARGRAAATARRRPQTRAKKAPWWKAIADLPAPVQVGVPLAVAVFILAAIFFNRSEPEPDSPWSAFDEAAPPVEEPRRPRSPTPPEQEEQEQEEEDVAARILAHLDTPQPPSGDEEAERAEQERIAAEQREAEERARAEQERIAREEAERAEQERIAAEQRESEERARAEQERIAREEAERAEQERIAAEQREAEERARIEQERIAREEAERAEQERIAAEQREVEERARVEQERIAREEAERAEQERIAAEQREAEERARIEQERIAREEAERAEQQRIAAEQREAEERARIEQERIAREEAERAEQQRIAAEQREAEERARAEQERIAAEQREAEERARAEQERIAAEQREAEERARIEQERIAREEAERAEQERVAAVQRAEAELEQLPDLLEAAVDQAMESGQWGVLRERISEWEARSPGLLAQSQRSAEIRAWTRFWTDARRSAAQLDRRLVEAHRVFLDLHDRADLPDAPSPPELEWPGSGDERADLYCAEYAAMFGTFLDTLQDMVAIHDEQARALGAQSLRTLEAVWKFADRSHLEELVELGESADRSRDLLLPIQNWLDLPVGSRMALSELRDAPVAGLREAAVHADRVWRELFRTIEDLPPRLSYWRDFQDGETQPMLNRIETKHGLVMQAWPKYGDDFRAWRLSRDHLQMEQLIGLIAEAQPSLQSLRDAASN